MFRIFSNFRSATVDMSSLTVTVMGNDSTNLVCKFSPPLELTGEWYVGLLDFTTHNSIPNVIEGKNNAFPVFINDMWTVVKLPTGAYEVDDNERYLKKVLGRKKIILRPNNSTFKFELACKYIVNFAQSIETSDTIGSMLVFKTTKSLEAYKIYESDSAVDIIKVNTVQIHCNIVQGTYTDGKNEQVLHSFYHTVEPGFKIVESPSNVIYLPVDVRLVDNVSLSLVDQDSDAIDFRIEIITLRLHLKRI